MPTYTPQTPLFALTEDGEIRRVVALLTEAPASPEAANGADSEGDMVRRVARRIMIHLAGEPGGVTPVKLIEIVPARQRPYLPAALDSLQRQRRITQMMRLWFAADDLTEEERELAMRARAREIEARAAAAKAGDAPKRAVPNHRSTTAKTNVTGKDN